MNDLMIDIETLGNKVDSVMLSISAVQFDLPTGKLGEEFHIDIDAESCVRAGLNMSVDTIMWWFEQDEDARMKMVNTYKSGETVQLAEALYKFNTWIEETFDTKKVMPWGNSNRFDLGIIAYSMQKCYMEPAWKHWNEKDVRTLNALAPHFKKEEVFQGIKHYGIDDSKFQISYCHKAYKFIMDKHQ